MKPLKIAVEDLVKALALFELAWEEAGSDDLERDDLGNYLCHLIRWLGGPVVAVGGGDASAAERFEAFVERFAGKPF